MSVFLLKASNLSPPNHFTECFWRKAENLCFPLRKRGMETPHSDKSHSPLSRAVGSHLPPILPGTCLAPVAASSALQCWPWDPKHKEPPGALQLPQTTLQNKWKIPSVSWEVSYRYPRWLPREVQWKPMLQASEVQIPGTTKPDFLSKSVDHQYLELKSEHTILDPVNAKTLIPVVYIVRKPLLFCNCFFRHPS